MSHFTIPRVRAATLTGLAVYNVVQNRLIVERGYVAGNVVVTAGVVAAARSCGLTAKELGLTGSDQRTTSLVGGYALVAGAGFLGLAAFLPALAARLDDGRIPGVTPIAAVRRAVVRFPLGTALFEEIVFRGVLPPLLAPGSDSSGDRKAALVFGLWHLIPTHRALSVNKVAPSRGRMLMGTVVGSAAAGAAGYVLSWLRRRTGGVIAPWLVHSVVNASSYIGVVLARRYRGRG